MSKKFSKDNIEFKWENDGTIFKQYKRFSKTDFCII